MAGIAGVYGKSDKTKVTEMLEALMHRGPDHKHIHEQNGFVGGAIASNLSPHRGDGFACEDNTTLFFDGEIYNEREGNTSDAEIALELYKKYGRVFPGYLQGVFGCAVFDGDELILARDPVGVRPLYWGKDDDGTIYYSSELKALTHHVDKVQELHPTTTFSSQIGISGYLVRYPEITVPSSPEEAINKLRQLLISAVERRIKDQAVGACLLSGGLDSSIIAAVAHQIKPDLPMVTVGMETSPDLEYAYLMAEHLGAKHEVFIFDIDQIVEMVPKAVYTLESFDEDCVSGAIANLFASKTATKFTNCILSGEGGDELFGGYHLLKDQPTETRKLQMMNRLIEIAFNTAVQRLDRAMLGNSINYRTPFIDFEVIAYALQLPVQWKIHPAENGEFIEKWILRQAFKDMLPEKIFNRKKLRFSGGTGTDDIMDQVVKERVKEEDFNETTRNTPGKYYLNSPKELWYYKIFKEKFPAPDFETLVGRWDPYK